MNLRITHSFDVALIVRGRRRRLGLRQAEVAAAAEVGREWLIDVEHGKPTAEIGKVLRTLEALGISLVVDEGDPPRWSRPLTAAARERGERLDAIRPKSRPRKPRKDITPPDDWPWKHLW